MSLLSRSRCQSLAVLEDDEGEASASSGMRVSLQVYVVDLAILTYRLDLSHNNEEFHNFHSILFRFKLSINGLDGLECQVPLPKYSLMSVSLAS